MVIGIIVILHYGQYSIDLSRSAFFLWYIHLFWISTREGYMSGFIN